MTNKQFNQIVGRVKRDARSSASFNPTLTNYAVSAAAEVDISDATYLAPVCPVPSTVGKYKRYTQKEQVVVYNTARALGGEPTMIGFNKEDLSYDCAPQALGTFIDDATREAAPDGGVAEDEDGIRNVVQAARRALVYKVITKIRAAKAAHATYGKWSDPAVSPIVELNGAIKSVALQSGLLPNRIWLDLGMWESLVNHPLVVKQMPGAEVSAANIVRIKQMLTLNPAIDIKIGTAIIDTGNPGSNAASTDFIGAGSCFVFYAEPSPTRYSPNFATVFSKNANLLGEVRSWRQEPATDKHAIMWSEDIQVPSSISGVRIDRK